MKKILTIIFSASMLFSSGLYDNSYSLKSDNNQIETKMDKHLMYEKFDKVLRFKPIFFDSSTNLMKEESQKYLDDIINAYHKYEDRDITFTIIGYTDHVQTKTEKVNQSWWFSTYTNDLTIESSQKISLQYATEVQAKLELKGIPNKTMIVEQRGGADNLYARATEEGRDKNYRAMVSMYISKDKNADSDNDGVIDSKDKCSLTPKGHNVDENGCSEILNLTIQYNENSHKITEKSLEKLKTLIDFMHEYPEFNVLLYGHTSIEGTKLNNQLLSEKRALSIRKYLMSKKIKSSRISVYGKAATEPIASNVTLEGRQKNRRVEIKLY